MALVEIISTLNFKVVVQMYLTNCGLFLSIAVLWYLPEGNETYQEIPQSGYSVFGSKFEHRTFLAHI
jgi:hypothetical protein